jgi:hypothetical protein
MMLNVRCDKISLLSAQYALLPVYKLPDPARCWLPAPPLSRLQSSSADKETRLNLFWLKYVSYAFLAGAAFFYFVLRLNRLALARSTKIILYAACVVLACVTWRVQESNASEHSPRQLAMGTVAWVSANHHKSGSIDDDFQLKLDSGTSPRFSTEIVANSAAQQPIHQGDLLGVLYRTWDDVPLTIDEIQGQNPGWHYRRYDNGGSYVFAVSIVGLFGLISVLFTTRNQRPRVPAPETTLNLKD